MLGCNDHPTKRIEEMLDCNYHPTTKLNEIERNAWLQEPSLKLIWSSQQNEGYTKYVFHLGYSDGNFESTSIDPHLTLRSVSTSICSTDHVAESIA